MRRSMPKALITGITGQDGSYLAEFLLGKGYEVHGIVRRLSAPNMTNLAQVAHRVHLHDGDLLDASSLHRIMSSVQPDEVYNLAAQSFVVTSFNQPAFTGEVTALGVIRVLEALRQFAPKARFYQASSSEMFGLVRETPQTETTPFHPRSPYGVAKVYGYWATVNYRESYGLHTYNGILFNHESPRRGLEFVTRKIARAAVRISVGLERELVLGNMDAGRDWGYAPEFVEGIWRIVQQPKADDFVLATGETHTVREFCEMAFAEVGIKDWQKHLRSNEATNLRPAEVPALRGDSTKARKAFGWQPKVKLPDLVRLMVQAEKERLETKEV